MAYLLDTSILVRLANSADVQHATAARAVFQLHRSGELLQITPQVLIEFRNVATRPKSANGAGLSIMEAERHAAMFEGKFPLLPDVETIFPAWKTLVNLAGVIGKRVHDARLVAVCHVHQVTHLLTFNLAHFLGIAAFDPRVVVVDPSTI